MNIFGLIATGLICGTILGISLIISKKGVTITHINKLEHEKQEIIQQPVTDIIQIKDEDQLAKNSMDSVIAAVNDLMGIQKEETDGRNE